MKLLDIAQQNGLEESDFREFLVQYGYPVTVDTNTDTYYLEDVYIRSAVRDYCAAVQERLREQMLREAALREREAALREREAALRERRKKHYRGFLFRIAGARGRVLEVYNNKCIIQTRVTVGSIITGNATDGEKTIFYPDCTGIQFKLPGIIIGYLQLETPAMQMNNATSNFFSENTFTFEGTKHNELMSEVYCFVSELVGKAKYGQLEPDKVTVPEYLKSLLPDRAEDPLAEE